MPAFEAIMFPVTTDLTTSHIFYISTYLKIFSDFSGYLFFET